MPGERPFRKEEIDAWGDPRDWNLYSPPLHGRDATQGGRSAISNYRLWPMIERALKELRQRRGRQNPNS